MKDILGMIGLAAIVVASVIGCGATSAESQRSAQVHQINSDEAADQGQYKLAEEEQRAAADSHHDAVTKALDEGKPIPPQTKRGDPPPVDAPK
jgi:hypothetical protein